MFDLGSAVGYLTLDTSGFVSGISNARSQMDELESSSSSLSSKLQGIGSTISGIGVGLTAGLTTPILGAGAAVIKFSSDSQSAFSLFRAQVGEVSKDMGKYRDVMDEIYKNNYGEDYEDIANSMGSIVKVLGEMDPSNLQETTESALALRDTFGYEVDESIRTVDTLMKNFGLTSQEAFDFIVKGQQEGLDYSGEFLDTLNEYSVQFGKLGLDANDMFNILKEGADSGAWNLDKIGDAIKEFSIRVIDGSDTTEMGFSRIGLNAEEMAAKFSQGGEEAKQAFQDTVAALSEMDNAVMQNIAGTELFGTMWEDLGPEVIFQMGSISDEAVNMKGSMDTLKEVRYDNIESALEGLARSIQVAASSFGDLLIPKVEEAIDFVDGLVDKFEGLSPEMQNTIINVGATVAAIGPLLAIGGQLISLIGSIGPAISLLAGPVGIAVAAVAGLVVAWKTDFGGIQEKTMEIFQSIQEIITSVMSILKTIWENDLGALRTQAELIWNSIEVVFTTVLDTLVGIFDVFAALFKGDWEGVWNGIKGIFDTIWKGILSLLDNFLDMIIVAILNLVVSGYKAGQEAFESIKKAFTEVWESIIEWFEKVVDDPVGAILDLSVDMFNAGRDIFNSLWNGIKDVWESIKNWVDEKIDWLVGKVKFWNSESEKMDSGGIEGRSGGAKGSYASGLDYVPRDMTVKVHEGESILTKQQTGELVRALDTLSIGRGSGDLHISIPIDGVEFFQATIKDFRLVDSANPVIGRG